MLNIKLCEIGHDCAGGTEMPKPCEDGKIAPEAGSAICENNPYNCGNPLESGRTPLTHRNVSASIDNLCESSAFSDFFCIGYFLGGLESCTCAAALFRGGARIYL